MANIQITTNSAHTVQWINKVVLALDTTAQHKVISRVAWKAHSRLVRKTPKGWTGNTRQRWEVIRAPRRGYIVTNTAKSMLYLEVGTKDHGAKTAKMLFIPLTRAAALSGWHPKLKRGRDYILKKRVKGITAMHIVRDERRLTQTALRNEMVAFINSII